MQTWLSYPGQQDRCESDSAVIDTLLRKGWSIIPAPPVQPEPSCPPSVSSVKLLHILVEEGLYAVCTATINSIPDPIERQKAQITFLREPTIARNHPLVALVANAAGKTDAEIDDYFRRAA